MMIGADSPNVPRMADLTFLHQSMVRIADNHSPLPRIGSASPIACTTALR